MDPNLDPKQQKKDSSVGKMVEKPKSDDDNVRETDHEVGKTDSWIDTLAQRSTGLPDSSGQKKESDRSPWSYAGLGIQTAGTIALLTYMGYWLDGKYNFSPWATVTCATLGIVGSCYLLIKEVIQSDDKPRKGTK